MTTQGGERLFADHAGRILGSLTLCWISLQTGRFLLSPLLPSIINSLSLTAATAGLSLGMFQLVYAITQYPSGRVSDVSSRAAVLLPGLVLLIAAFLLLLVTTTVLRFLIAMVLLGAGKGLFSSPSRALLSSLFVDRRGRALGLYSSGTDIGGLLAACLAFIAVGGGARMLTGADWAAPLRTLGWRSPFVPVTLALIATTGLYWTWSREMLTIRRPTAGILATVRRLVTTREQREALFAFGLFFFTINAWINFLPTYLTEAKGLAPPLPQVLFAVVFIAGAGIKPAAGAVSDRVPRRLVAVTGLLLAVVALGAVTVVNSPGALAMAIGIFATGYKSQFPLVDALIMDAAPSDNTGGDIGAARAIFLGAGALGPVYMGVVATVADYETAIAGLAVGLLLSAGVLALSLRR